MSDKITVGDGRLIYFDADPTIGGYVAPIGSMGMWNSSGLGLNYVKYGAANTAWALVFGSNQVLGAPQGGSGFSSYSLRDILIGNGSTLDRRTLTLGANLTDSLSVAGVYTLATTFDTVASVYTVNTTNATPTLIASIPTTTNTVMLLNLKTLGRRTGGTLGTNGDSGAVQQIVKVKNVGGTVSVSAITALAGILDQILWGVGVNANGSNLEIKVTGALANNISWKTEVCINQL